MNTDRLKLSLLVVAALGLAGCASRRAANEAGTLNITLNDYEDPAPPRIYIDSDFIGAPAEQNVFKVSPGKHTVLIRSESYEDRKEEIVILGGGSKQTLILSPVPKAGGVEKSAAGTPGPSEKKASATPVDPASLTYEKTDYTKFSRLFGFYKDKPVEFTAKLQINGQMAQAENNVFMLVLSQPGDANTQFHAIAGVGLYEKCAKAQESRKAVIVRGVGIGAEGFHKLRILDILPAE